MSKQAKEIIQTIKRGKLPPLSQNKKNENPFGIQDLYDNKKKNKKDNSLEK